MLHQGPIAMKSDAVSALSRPDDLAQFVGMVRRQKRSILALVVILPALVLLYLAVVPPRYTAWSQINIDPRGERTMDADVVPSGYGNDIAITDSQLKIITSDSVLLPVVKELGLADDPSFGPSALRTLLGHLLGRDPQVNTDRQLEALRELRQRVTAKRAERTYVIEVGVWSTSPEKAAELTRAVTRSYLADHQKARASTVRSVADFLSSRLDDLRNALVQSEKQAEDYKAKHDLVSVNDVQVTEQQLSDLSAQLALASVRVSEAQARFDTVRRLRAEKTPQGGLTAALNSPVINELRKQAAEVARNESMMASSLGPKHPALMDMRQQSARINGMIADELKRIYNAAQSDLDIARDDEAGLKRRVSALRAATMTTNRALVGLRQLEREVEARRNTYQAFLSRSQIAGEQEGNAASNLRIITPATVPESPNGPGRVVLLVVALLMALLIGIGQGLLRDRLMGGRFATLE